MAKAQVIERYIDLREAMIDHLDINTTIVHRESAEGKIQLKALYDKGIELFDRKRLHIGLI